MKNREYGFYLLLYLLVLSSAPILANTDFSSMNWKNKAQTIFDITDTDSLKYQTNSPAALDLFWQDTTQYLNNEALFNNKLFIVNSSEKTQAAQIDISLPKHWTLIYDPMDMQKTLAPNDTFSLPFQFFIPKTAMLSVPQILSGQVKLIDGTSKQTQYPIVVMPSRPDTLSALVHTSTIIKTLPPITVKFEYAQVSANRNTLVENALYLTNNTDTTLVVTPMVDIPERWTLIYRVHKNITLAAHESKKIPIRLFVPPELEGGENNDLSAKILDQSGKVLTHTQSQIYLKKVSYPNMQTQNEGKKTSLAAKKKTKKQGKRKSRKDYLEQINNGLAITFVKTESIHDPSITLYFNSLRVRNISNDTVVFHPILKMPKGWQLASFLPIPKTITLAPKDIVFIPFKIDINKYSEAGKDYKLVAQLFTIGEDPFLLNKTSTPITITEQSDWDIELVNEDVLLPKNSKEVTFLTRLKNTGNVKEKVAIEFKLNGEVKQQFIEMKPGFDSTFHFITPYENSSGNSRRGSSLKFLKINANNGDTIQSQHLSILTFEHKYNALHHQERPHTLVLSVNNLFSPNLTLNGRLFGTFKLKENRRLVYQLAHPDLFFRRNNSFAQSLRYRLGYYSKPFDAILGNTSSLGEGLHNVSLIQGNNTFDVATTGANNVLLRFKLHSAVSQQTSFSLLQNLRRRITNVGIEHQLKQYKGLTLHTGLYYALDHTTYQTQQRHGTAIASMRADFQISENHTFDIALNGVQEQYIYQDTLSQEDLKLRPTVHSWGYQSLFQYSGYFSRYVNMGFSHQYASVKYPSIQRGIHNLSARLNYYLQGNGRYHLALGYRLIHRPMLAPLNEQQTAVSPSLKRQQWSTQYNMVISPKVRLSMFGLLEEFQTRHPQLTATDLPFSSRAYNMGSTVHIKRGRMRWTGSLLHRIYMLNDFTDNTTKTIVRDVPRTKNWTASLMAEHTSWRTGINYNNGPAGTGIATPSNEEANNQIRSSLWSVFGSWSRSFVKKTIKLTTTSRYTQSNRAGRSNKNIGLSSSLSAQFKNAWSIQTNAFLSYSIGSRIARPQVSIEATKNFNMKWRKRRKAKDLTVVCFKDINNNGQQEDTEGGISNIQVTLTNKPEDTKSADHRKMLGLPPQKLEPISLFTDEEGKVVFKNIPENQYHLNVQRVYDNTDGYFNNNYSNNDIILNNDGVYKVPFEKSNIIYGAIIVDKDQITTLHHVNTANIRITATSYEGTTYSVLTDELGNFRIPVPNHNAYTVTVNDVLSSRKLTLVKNNQEVYFKANTEVEVKFLYKEKKRKINFK